MDHSYRCTNCTWRGTREEASAHRAPPSSIPESVARIQIGYEEAQHQNALLGELPPPACPVCGQHTMKVHLHRRKAAG